jgi:hypothetical protein
MPCLKRWWPYAFRAAGAVIAVTVIAQTRGDTSQVASALARRGTELILNLAPDSETVSADLFASPTSVAVARSAGEIVSVNVTDPKGGFSYFPADYEWSWFGLSYVTRPGGRPGLPTVRQTSFIIDRALGWWAGLFLIALFGRKYWLKLFARGRQ